MTDAARPPRRRLLARVAGGGFRLAVATLAAVIVGGVLACVAVAYDRSTALRSVTVTALDAEAEPRDHAVPFLKPKEALPDYEVRLRGDAFGLRGVRSLGAKPDRSAAAGLRWAVDPPASLAEVATVELRDRDAVLSDVLAAAPPGSGAATDGNYRFEFETGRDWGVGVSAFFETPVGKALTAGIVIAVVLLLLVLFA